MQQILTHLECHVKFFSIITVLDFNVYSIKSHMGYAFQVSPAMKVTCSSGWSDIL